MKICLDCGVCCLKTEMQLSQDDIERIENSSNNNLKREDFCELKEEYFQLKNIDEHCYFFDPTLKRCIIYPNRPKGCEFYPLIFNIDDNKCELDADCPHRNLFYRHSPEFQKKCKELRDWIKNQLMSQDQLEEKQEKS
jgi:Fe-S-cluster containining protein